jgi:hypothetical protein
LAVETSSVWNLVQSGVVPAALLGLSLWNSDKVISEDGAKTLYREIEGAAKNPGGSRIAEVLEAFLRHHFSVDHGILRFLRNVLLLTLLSLFAFLAVYTYTTKGLVQQLLTTGFLRQFFGNGFVVTFLVNTIVLLTYPLVIAWFARDSLRRNLFLLLLDLIFKVALFFFLTAITYMFFASAYGAFGDDVMNALRAVPRTIGNAIQFRNLTSVYLYSLLLSSFPVFVVMLLKLMAREPKFARAVRGLLFWLPFKSKPLRAASAVFALFCGVLGVLTALLAAALKTS